MNKKDKIIAWSSLLLWMGLIFFMSSQPAEISNSQSDLIIKIFEVVGIDLDARFGNLASLIVRKGAHLTEYFILYILAYRVVIIYKKEKFAIIYTLIIVFVYACSDEIHQYFVPGRAMAIRDVIIDTIGGIIACFIIKIYNKYIKKSKSR